MALTPITSAIPWNDVDLLQEIIDGLARRAAVAGVEFETASWWPRRYPTDGLTVTGVYGVEQAAEPATEEEYSDHNGTVYEGGIIYLSGPPYPSSFAGQVLKSDLLEPGTKIVDTNGWDYVRVQASSVLSPGTTTIRFYPQAVANGTAGPYYLVVKKPPIQPESLTVTAGGQTLTDDGAGRLEQDGVKRGRVSYRRGVVVAIFDEPVPEDTDITLDYTTDVTALTVDVVPGFVEAMVGCRMEIEDVGAGKILAVKELLEEEENGYATAWVPGDLTCEAVTYSIIPTAVVQTAEFWNRLYDALMELVPHFVDHTRPKGEGGQPNDPGNYEKLAAVPMFTVDTWLEAMEAHEDGLRFVPTLRVDGVYDPDADTTELTQTDPAEGWFTADMAGCKVEIAGLGEFEIVECSGTTATVEGNAAAAGRMACVLPLDWEDVEDPAYGHRKESSIVAAGDVIGPWMLADLQVGMLALQKTGFRLSLYAWVSKGEASVRQGTGDVTWTEGQQAAYAAGKTAYDAATPEVGGDGQAPTAAESDWIINQRYWCTLRRAYAYIAWTVPTAAADMPRDVDYYARAYPCGGSQAEWDGNGDFPEWCTGDGRLVRVIQETQLTGQAGISETAWGRNAPGAYPALSTVEGAGRGYHTGVIYEDAPWVVLTWTFEED